MIEPVSPIGESPEWLEALEQASRVARLERPILVIGERGTGKELIGERLHFLSGRWNGPFVKVNCAALNEELLDSELFGHEVGAFTGATKRRVGRFEQADGGTIFLDEIATASQRVQEKLLRVVEYGEFQRLGGEDVLSCDVRVTAATNVDLPSKVEEGEFRADLLDRLAFDVVTLPPLKERMEDISLLADHFGTGMARELGYDFPGFSASAILALEAHDWPGNVRELKNVAERLTHYGLQQSSIEPIGFEPSAIDPFDSPYRPKTRIGKKPPSVVPENPLRVERPMMPETPERGEPIDFQGLTELFEVQLIEFALDANLGHQARTADQLGLTYHQLRGLLRKHGLETKRKKDSSDAGTEKQPIRSM